MRMKNFFTRLFGFTPAEKNPEEEPTVTFAEYWQALRYLPPFLKMAWQTQPVMLTFSMIFRLFVAVLTPAKLYVAKLIIDAVLQIIESKSTDYQQLWFWVAVEVGLVIVGEILLRYTNLLESLLGDLLANESSVRIMEHASRLDLQQFEDATFYDRLERARRQTVGRTFLFVQIFAQFQEVFSVAMLGIALTIFDWNLLWVLLLSVIPAFISETYFNRKDYSLARS